MTTPTYTDNKNRIFISYARKDGQEIADAIRKDLEAKGYSIWHDVVAMEGGEKWWLQIKEAIENCAVMVFVLTDGAIESPVVIDEWTHARTVGTPILPVTKDDDIFAKAPKWISQVDVMILDEDNQNYDKTYARFLRQIENPPERKPRPFTVPNLPDNFIPRPDESERLIEQLLDADRTSPVAITTALQGGGGFGKTTLAKAVCSDSRIRVAFDDGILWMQFREEMSQEDILRLIDAQIQLLVPNDKPNTDITIASARLRELLADRNILIVLDDVWKERYLRHCVHSGTAYLITTRIEDVVIEADAEATVVDEMTAEQSYGLLVQGIEFDEGEEETLKDQLLALAEQCKGWALLLNLVNGAYKKQAKKRNPSRALDRILEDLEDEGFVTFDRRNDGERNSALNNSLSVSLNLLEKEDIEALIEIGIFPEDTPIPVTTLAQLWAMSDKQALRLCEDFSELSLFKLNTKLNTIEVHDVIRQLLKTRLSNIADVNQKLVDTWDNLSALPDDYAWNNIAYHLNEAQQRDTLRDLLLNFEYLQNKLNATDVNALIADCTYLPDDPTIRLIQSGLEVSSHVLAENKEALNYQLRGRLGYHEGDDITAFLASIPQTILEPINKAWLNPAGGALLRIMQGHSNSIEGAIQLQDENILSWSGRFGSTDYTLRLWDENGTPIVTFLGHSDTISNAIQLYDSNILSWSSDKSLRLWRADGTPITTFEGHSDYVRGAIQLYDGNILSWSSDKSLRLWRADGTLITTFEGHADYVRGAIQLYDGNILSWSSDKSLRLWHVDGTSITTFEGHSNAVRGAIHLNSGNILSWAGGFGSIDNTLYLWNTNGKLITAFNGHLGAVSGAIQLHNDNILSWAAEFGSTDYTLRLWHTDGTPIATLEGHSNVVREALQLNNGNILSWSSDKTLRLWEDDGTPVTALEGHSDTVINIIQLHNDNILSWAGDKSLRLWQDDGTAISTLEGHSNSVSGMIQLRNRNVLSWSGDKTLRLWNTDLAPITTLEQHSDDVHGAIQLHNDNILSWSDDKTLRLWQTNGTLIATFEGHSGAVSGMIQLHNSNILSWSDVFGGTDYTLHLWQSDGTPITTLEGHSNDIRSAIQLHDGNVLSWSGDYTLRLWQSDGTPITTLEGHSSPVSNAIQLYNDNILSWSDEFGSTDYDLRLWQSDGTPITTLKGHSNDIRGAIQLHDGNILSWSDDKTLCLWQANGTLITALEGHSNYIYGAIQLSDGKLLSWGRDHTLHLWQANGTSITKLKGHSDFIYSATQFPNGNMISWSADNTLRLWRKDGSSLATLEGHTDEISGAVQLNNGSILSWSKDGTLRLWGQDAQSLSVFYTDAPITACVVIKDERTIVLGDTQGRVIFVEYHPERLE